MSISVIIPAYNAQLTIEYTLDCLLKQTYQNWEAIIVDNCCTDDTSLIVKSYISRDSRFKLISENTQGVSRARNSGIEVASADYLLFLDSDDWILPETLEKLLAPLLNDSSLDAVYCASIRVAADGQLVPIHFPNLKGDLFELFSYSCGFPIHSCLVKKEIVKKIKGFDVNIHFGEDWDFWQKYTRTGANFFCIDDKLAMYRMRQGSAILNPNSFYPQHQILKNATEQDPRIDCADPRNKMGVSKSNLGKNVFELLGCCAALLIGQNRSADELIEEIVEYKYEQISAYFLAYNFYDLIPCAHQSAPSIWPEIYYEYLPKIESFLSKLENAIGHDRLSIKVIKALEHYILQNLTEKREVDLYYSASRNIDLSESLADLEFAPSVEILHLRYSYLGQYLNLAKFPVFDCIVPAEVICELVSSWSYWDILRLYFEKYYYPDVIIEQTEHDFLFKRNEICLARGYFENVEQARLELHNIVWVNLLNQEINLSNQGLCLNEFKQELTQRDQPTFPRLLVRETIIGKTHTTTSLAQRLNAAIGRANKYTVSISGHSHFPDDLSLGSKTLLPSVLADSLIETAQSLGQSVTVEENQKPLRVFYNPEILSKGRPRKSQKISNENVDSMPARLYDRDYFEKCFLISSDPWDYTSSYEKLKYDQTLEIIPNRKYNQALELACAGGHFTSALAGVVERLVVADISSLALNKVKQRCKDLLNKLSFIQIDFMKDQLPDKYDLIVCSEALYCCETETVLAGVAEKVANALEVGGYFVTANANVFGEEPGAPGFDWPENFGSITIRDVFKAQRKFKLVKEFYNPLYKIFLFQRISEEQQHSDSWERSEVDLSLTERVNKQVCWDTTRTKAKYSKKEVVATNLPVLLYHRIVDDVSGPLARYCVSVDNFNLQMKFLRDAGYYSIDLEQWLNAVNTGQPLPGRPILISFDDGYEDFYTTAWPILGKNKFSALVFLVAKYIGATNSWDRKYKQETQLMNWSQIHQLRDAGVVFGSHSLSHQYLSTLSATEALSEIYLSRALLEEGLGYLVEAFAAPYGDQGALVQSLIKTSGYLYAFTTSPQKCAIENKFLYAMPRIEIFGSDTFEDFIRKLY